MNIRSSSAGFRLPEPLFNSRITDLVIDLEFLRRKNVNVTTDPFYIDQFRWLFHHLDTLGSSRIDGNKTGLNKYLESLDDDPESKGRKVIEVEKVANAMKIIDENIDETIIFQGFFTELHRLICEGITQHSTQIAGKYRTQDARPDRSYSNSPPAHLVETYIDKLISMIGKKEDPKFDSIKIAYAHQRYLWIHPFREANGLTGRLLSYTMLLRMGFGSEHHRIINASYGICHDPEKYLALIQKADNGKEKDMLAWIEFALEGLRNDLERMDQLCDYSVVKEHILIPAFKHPMFERVFSDQDRLIIDVAIDKQVFQAGDIRLYFPKKQPSEISKMLKWLKEKEWIIGLDENARKYAINFQNKYLVKFVVSKLEKAGFIPII